MSALLSGSDSENDFPLGWEERTTMDGTVYYNHSTKSTQWTHPRAGKRKKVAGELPSGLEEAADGSGRILYVNHNNHQTTYIDPRLTLPKEEKDTPLGFRQRLDSSSSALQILDGRDVSGKSDRGRAVNFGIGYFNREVFETTPPKQFSSKYPICSDYKHNYREKASSSRQVNLDYGHSPKCLDEGGSSSPTENERFYKEHPRIPNNEFSERGITSLERCRSPLENSVCKAFDVNEDSVFTKHLPCFKLAIVPFNYPVTKILQDNILTRILKCIREAISTNFLDREFIGIKGGYLEKGAVIVVCENEASKDWLKSFAPSLNSLWPRVKALNYEDLESYFTEVQAFLYKKYPNWSTFIDKLSRHKSLGTEAWEVKKTETVRVGTLFYIYLDKQSLHIINKRFKWNFKFSKRRNAEFSVTGTYSPNENERFHPRLPNNEFSDRQFECTHYFINCKNCINCIKSLKRCRSPLEESACKALDVNEDSLFTKHITCFKLAIVPFNYPVTKIFQDDMLTRIFKWIGEAICTNLRERGFVPKIKDGYLEKGAVIVVCEDEFSKDWMESFVPSLNLHEPGVKALNYEDLGSYFTEVQALVYNKYPEWKKFIDKLRNEYNGLETEVWELKKIENLRIGKLFYICLDKQSLQVINLRFEWKFPFSEKSIVEFSLAGFSDEVKGPVRTNGRHWFKRRRRKRRLKVKQVIKSEQKDDK